MDPQRLRPENFWTVSTTAMTQAEAERAAALIEEHFPEVYADAVNPKSFLTMSMDRWTAEAVREALHRFVVAGGDVGNLLEAYDEFLFFARPYDDGEQPRPGLA